MVTNHWLATTGPPCFTATASSATSCRSSYGRSNYMSYSCPSARVLESQHRWHHWYRTNHIGPDKFKLTEGAYNQYVCLSFTFILIENKGLIKSTHFYRILSTISTYVLHQTIWREKKLWSRTIFIFWSPAFYYHHY